MLCKVFLYLCSEPLPGLSFSNSLFPVFFKSFFLGGGIDCMFVYFLSILSHVCCFFIVVLRFCFDFKFI